MKKSLLAVLLLLSSFAAAAQQQDTAKLSAEVEKRFYVGVGVSTVSYMLSFNSMLGGSIEPLVTPHIGYRLNRRLNVQLSIGYDKDREAFGGTYFENEEDEDKGILTYDDSYNTTWGWAVPIMLEFTPFNTNKRLQLYTTAKLVPTYGASEFQSIRRREGITTVLATDEGSGFNTFFIGGLLLKYRINRRIDAYLEGNLIYKDLQKYSPYAEYGPKTFGIGINYKL
ncbi:outer membrane beta-barrel protein [Pontibacter russatus]|uniref:outer membrane beta-barrel protein n=1 Tax=Pontibacter russatus TaxID=2694929 RepID=UPI00137A78DD|nr:outer membrane beta-barrel protein [Pontibacter russatus]